MCKFILPKISFNIERWKWNAEYRVYVSNLGHFKDEHKRNLPIKIQQATGYCFIKTEIGYKVAHRLVMFTWRPIPNAEELTVDHLDHNKRNNKLDNLEWVTQEENQKRAKEDLINVDGPAVIKRGYWKAGSKVLKTEQEIIGYIKAKNGCQATDEVILKRVQNAINNKHSYCGVRWSRI